MAAGTFLKLTAKRLAFAAIPLVVCACGDGGQAGRELQGKAEDPALPVLGKVPDFELTDHTASPFGSARLDSGLWVANFIFTRCAATCPLQTATMAQLQERLKAKNLLQEITLVSFSVDPGFDSPEVLRRYGEEYGADPDRWRFLTGSREEIWDLSKAGFKLGSATLPRSRRRSRCSTAPGWSSSTPSAGSAATSTGSAPRASMKSSAPSTPWPGNPLEDSLRGCGPPGSRVHHRSPSCGGKERELSRSTGETTRGNPGFATALSHV